jgi:hypothetical protein
MIIAIVPSAAEGSLILFGTAQVPFLLINHYSSLNVVMVIVWLCN